MGWGTVWSLVLESASGDDWQGLLRGLAGFGLTSGVLTWGNIGLIGAALEEGDASTVLPLYNCSFILTTVISVGFGLEDVDRYKTSALMVALLAVTALALDNFS